MENEALQTLMHYFSNENGTELHFLGTGVGAQMFSDFFQNGEKYIGDAPDMLLKKKNEALIIEHFTFDSYHVNRKGSQNRKEQNRIRRREELVKATDSGALFHDKINGKSSYSDYLKNVSKSFTEHYAHISIYRDNLKKHGLIDDDTQTYVLFLIDDVSPLGTMASTKDEFESKVIPITLALCNDFLSLLSSSPDVNYVLSCSSAGNYEYVWFIDRAEIDTYIKNAVNYANMNFMDFIPQVLSYKITIPTNK